MGTGGYKIRNKAGVHFITFAVVDWVDVFSRSGYVEILLNSLRFCQTNKGLIIHAWCVMSNHVHFAVSAKDANTSEIMRDFKKFTSRQILDAIRSNIYRESRRDWMLALFRRAGQANSHNYDSQFWQQQLHPIELYSPFFIRQKINYIHRNPVKAGIVDRPEEYRWSSARDYVAGGGPGLLEVERLFGSGYLEKEVYPETESPDDDDGE